MPPSGYPGALDTFATNKADGSSTPTDHPTHHNDLADAVNKIEAELGITPSGAFATVVARLNFSGALIYNAANITNQFVNNTRSAALFDTEQYDTDGYHEGVTNPSRLTAPVAGYYLIGGTIGTELAGGVVIALIRLNGTTDLTWSQGVNGGAVQARVQVTTPWLMAANDYVELMCLQTSGGDLDQIGTLIETRFWIHRIGI